MSKNRKQNTGQHPCEYIPGKFIEEEVPWNDIHQAKCDYLQISLGSLSHNKSQYILPVKKGHMF